MSEIEPGSPSQESSQPPASEVEVTPPPSGETVPSASRFAQFHAQTYEMELLVSGALLFALVQVVGPINAHFHRAMTFIAGDSRLLVTYAFVYLSLAVTALICFFSVHLMLRAFWIGLVGLESVYPGGVAWDKLKLGPHYAKSLRRTTPPLASSIEKLDDVCSLVFSLAFLIVLTFVYSIAIVALCLTVSWAGARLLGWPYDRIFWGTFLTVAVSGTAVALVDKYLGSKFPAGRRADRALGWLVRVTLVISPLRLMGQISLVLQSRLSERRTNVLIVGSVVILSIAMLGSLLARDGLFGFGSLVYQPEDAGTEGVEAKSYRTNWNEDDFNEASWRPSIDAEVVTGPYLRLFLPYRPGTHNDRIAARCPDLDRVRDEGLSFGVVHQAAPTEQSRMGVECLVGLFVISIDGEVRDDLRFDWYTEPSHGIPGVIAYVDVRGMSVGRHVIEIDAPRGEPPKSATDTDRRRSLVIPFWR